MNLVIDYTESSQYSISELESMQQINQITMIVPIFIFFQNNFKLLLSYVQFLNQRPLIKTNIKPVIQQDEVKKLEEHSVVLIRGTFDHLHLGHQVMLLKAIFSTSHKLIIQIKDDSIMNNKRLKQLIQPIDIRKENVKKFVDGLTKNLKPQFDVKIQVITEPYGSAPYTKGIDAIVISQQSIHSFNHINKLRKSNSGLKKVKTIVAPLMTSVQNPSLKTKQQRVDNKLSSYKIREFILKVNNLTLSQYIDYRSIWDSLVKQINALCRIKDIDFIIVEKWWERIIYKYQRKIKGKKIRKNNRQIYQQIFIHNNMSTPNQHSLSQIALNLALLFDGLQQEQKNMQIVVRNFLQNLLKKKGKSKACKKIRKMIMNDIKQYVQKTNTKKGGQSNKITNNEALELNKTINITNLNNTNNDSLQLRINETVKNTLINGTQSDNITIEAQNITTNIQQKEINNGTNEL